MIVVDASVLVEVLLGVPTPSALGRRLFETGETLHAPHLIDVEVAHVVRRYAAGGEIGAERGRAAIADLMGFPLRRYPHRALMQRAWALRANVTAYDGVYVALAEALEVPLLTRDRRLAASSGHHARIELL